MALWRVESRVGDVNYDVGIEWDDDAFIEGKPEIKVQASVRRGNGVPHSLSASVAIFESDLGATIAVHVQGREVARMPIADLLDESQIIDRVPAWVYGGGDPLTGCLLRAGLSSVLGQAIRCKKETQALEWYQARIRAIAQCMKANIGRIGWRTGLKAAKCVASAGV
jgi:hypothetical protein